LAGMLASLAKVVGAFEVQEPAEGQVTGEKKR
jgi:hypothetical protein